jgi:hypothetical protein
MESERIKGVVSDCGTSAQAMLDVDVDTSFTC